MTREEQRAKAAHEYIQSDSVAAGNEILAFGDFIEGAKWADFHPNWISVEDELPKERGQYFVYTAAGQSWQSEWMQDKSGEWYWFCSPMTVGTIAKVTHWMEIVPPRKEDKK